MDSPDPTADAAGPPTEEAEADDQAELDEDRDLAIDDAVDDGRRRLWVRALVPLIQLRTQETDPSSRVQFAFDQMYIAACERVGRICRSDLPPD